MTADSARAAGASMQPRVPRKAALGLVVVLAFAAGFVGRALFAPVRAPMSGSEVDSLRRRVAALESERDAPRAAPPPGRGLVALAYDERQAEQSRRIEALESGVAFALQRVAAEAPLAGAAGDDAADADPEVRRLCGLATPALLEQIRTLVGTLWGSTDEAAAGHARTIRACDALLARTVDAQRRAETLTLKGITCRAVGDFANADATMREALALVSPTSNEGVTAAMQLAFNLALRNEPRAAADRFLAIALQSEMPATVRAQCRHRAAVFYAGAHDVELAREHHGAVVEEFGSSDDPHTRYWADESRRELEKLGQGQ